MHLDLTNPAIKALYQLVYDKYKQISNSILNEGLNEETGHRVVGHDSLAYHVASLMIDSQESNNPTREDLVRSLRDSERILRQLADHLEEQEADDPAYEGSTFTPKPERTMQLNLTTWSGDEMYAETQMVGIIMGKQKFGLRILMNDDDPDGVIVEALPYQQSTLAMQATARNAVFVQNASLIDPRP